MLLKLLPGLRSALVGTLSLLATASLAQTTIHVGSGETYTTIQSGIDAANAGDTVLVGPGTYNENIDFKGKAITVISAKGAANTIIQGDGTAAVVTFDTSENRNSVINGFTIQGVSNPTPSQYYSGVLVGSAPTILNNVITNNPCNGIDVEAGGPLIQGNVISNTNATHDGQCSGFTGSGIALSGSSSPASVVIGNTIIHNQHAVDYDGGGIQIWAAENTVIEGNVFAENAAPVGEGGAIVSFNSDAMIIAQNLFYANVAEYGGGAIALHPPDETQGPFIGLIQNNTFVGNTSVSSTDEYGEPAASQVFVDANLGQYEFTDNIVVGADSNAALVCGTIYNYLSATPFVIDHNDIYNSAGPTYGGACPDQTGKYGNISADPLFKNAAGNDYHLLAGSPAIDTGNNSALQLLANLGYSLAGDLDGNPRVQDATGKGYPVIDMGAYEHPGSSSSNPTTMVLNPSAYNVYGGQSFTLTANMYSPLGTPTGTVTFIEDGNQIGTATLDSTGTATLTLGKGLVPGTHAFVATYPGEGKFTPCESVKIYVLMNGYGVTLNLTSAPNPSQFGQSVTFQIQTSSEKGIPSGSVTLSDSSINNILATLTLNASGNASYSTSTLAAGTHVIEAVYLGNATYLSASSDVSQVVESGMATTTTLSSSLNPSPFGAAITLTAAISSSGGSPTGTVALMDGSAPLATVPVQNGSAAYTTSNLSVGSHAITANYQPTGTFGASSASLTETIEGDTTSTALRCQPNPVEIDGTAQLTATVTSGSGTPTGSIAFADNGTILATRALLSGTTSFSYQGSVAGAHAITATYAPTGAFAGSSASCSEVVNALPTKSTLTVAPASSTFGSPVTLTATVSPAALPAPGAPTGTVTFLNGAAVLGMGTLAGGVATLAAGSLPGGSYNLGCKYGGSSIYGASNCNSVRVTVNAAPSALTLSSSKNPALYLSPVALTARLTVHGQSAGAGNAIHLNVHGQTVNLTTDATGSASYTIGTLAPDSYPVTASFAATEDLLASSASLTEVIAAAPTSTSLGGTPNPGDVKRAVTLTATVLEAGGSTAVGGGNVTFYNGPVSLGSSKLSANGKASLTTSFAAVGVYDLTAVFEGDADFSGSTSAEFKEKIVAGDFSIQVSPDTMSVYTGEASSARLKVTGQDGFNQPLALSCSGLPANATCTFSQSSLPDGQGYGRVTIQTAAPHKAATAATAAVLGGILLLLPAWRRRRGLVGGVAALLLAFGLGMGLAGCGSVNPITGGTPPGTYKVAVTASTMGTEAPLSHSAVVTLTVKSLF